MEEIMKKFKKYESVTTKTPHPVKYSVFDLEKEIMY